MGKVNQPFLKVIHKKKWRVKLKQKEIQVRKSHIVRPVMLTIVSGITMDLLGVILDLDQEPQEDFHRPTRGGTECLMVGGTEVHPEDQTCGVMLHMVLEAFGSNFVFCLNFKTLFYWLCKHYCVIISE